MGQEALEQAHEHRIAGDYDPAIELYRQVLAEDESNAEALWGLGLSLMNIGEFDDALATLDRAVQAEPNNPQYLLDAGKHYTMLGMYDEAKPYFEKVIELAPNSQFAGEAQKQLSYY
ncbi:MAG: tetratricopeptide repeat protein [Armatimonadetes bacterium]|nr:tetratricopeptide repeat protein [Armatimonadota bacterium]